MNMKTFFKILLLAVLFTSCEDVEPTIFNGNDSSNVTFLSFSSTSYSLPIERDLTGTSTVILNASTISSVDRTYNIEVIVEDLPTSANPATFSVPSSVTIPANEYQGFLVLTGTDGGLVDANEKTFTIKVSDASVTTESYDDGSLSAIIKVFEACELQSDFSGKYMLTQVSPNFGPTGGDTKTLQEGIVDVAIGNTPYERTFTAKVYPGFGFPDLDVVMSFTCDGINWGGPRYVGTNGCSEGNPISFDRSEDSAPYDTNDDSEFEFVFTEDITNSCNARRDVIFRLTKIN
jgi:hypothetical protein